MANDAVIDRLQALACCAALAGRPVAVAPLDRAEPSWTHRQIVFVDPSARPRENLESAAVYARRSWQTAWRPMSLAHLFDIPRLRRRFRARRGAPALAAIR